MKGIGGYVFPAALIVLGAGVFFFGAATNQNIWVKLGSFLVLATGAVTLLLQLGVLGRKGGIAIGAVFAALAVFLGYRNYRSVEDVLEFRRQKEAYDNQIKQALIDIREAQKAYRRANGVYTGNLEVLHEFVRSGTFPMVRAIGQVPDTLTEQQALELKLIVRDTIQVSALDSTFRTKRALEGRRYPFDPERFIYSPVTGKPFLLQAGVINSSGRNVPVMVCKDPTPMVPGDTLMVGSMERQTLDGNWRE